MKKLNPHPKERGKVLQNLIKESEPKVEPDRIESNDVVESFEETQTECLDQNEDQGARLAPEFVVETKEKGAEMAQSKKNQTMTCDEYLPIVKNLEDFGTNRPKDDP